MYEEDCILQKEKVYDWNLGGLRSPAKDLRHPSGKARRSPRRSPRDAWGCLGKSREVQRSSGKIPGRAWEISRERKGV
jgi:hypothetical protein